VRFKCILGMSWDTANDGSSQQTVNATGGINMEQDGNSASLTTAIKVKVFKGSTGSVDGQEVDYSGNYWSTIGDLA
jgi:sugar lactone lactonase YvrE